MKLKLSLPEKWYLVYCSLWNFLKRIIKLNLKKEKKYLKYFHKEFHHVLYHELTNNSRLLLQGIRILFSIFVLFHEHSRITGLHGMGEVIPLTPHYHFHPLHRHLDISRAITAENSPLHIASSRTWTGAFGLYCWLWTCFTFFTNISVAKFEQENVCFVKYVFKSTLKTLLQPDKNLSKVGRKVSKKVLPDSYFKKQSNESVLWKSDTSGTSALAWNL